MEPGQLVLVDTNIIIEAVRTRCWNALVGRFMLETVDKCLEEARTGDPMRRAYVAVDAEQLKGVRKAHSVSAVEKARLAVALPTADQLDAGERELFAHALGRNDAWIASCADRAALKAAFALGWKDRIVSLEALAKVAGAAAFPRALVIRCAYGLSAGAATLRDRVWLAERQCRDCGDDLASVLKLVTNVAFLRTFTECEVTTHRGPAEVLFSGYYRRMLTPARIALCTNNGTLRQILRESQWKSFSTGRNAAGSQSATGCGL